MTDDDKFFNKKTFTKEENDAINSYRLEKDIVSYYSLKSNNNQGACAILSKEAILNRVDKFTDLKVIKNTPSARVYCVEYVDNRDKALTTEINQAILNKVLRITTDEYAMFNGERVCSYTIEKVILSLTHYSMNNVNINSYYYGSGRIGQLGNLGYLREDLIEDRDQHSIMFGAQEATDILREYAASRGIEFYQWETNAIRDYIVDTSNIDKDKAEKLANDMLKCQEKILILGAKLRGILDLRVSVDEGYANLAEEILNTDVDMTEITEQMRSEAFASKIRKIVLKTKEMKDDFIERSNVYLELRKTITDLLPIMTDCEESRRENENIKLVYDSYMILNSSNIDLSPLEKELIPKLIQEIDMEILCMIREFESIRLLLESNKTYGSAKTFNEYFFEIPDILEDNMKFLQQRKN